MSFLLAVNQRPLNLTIILECPHQAYINAKPRTVHSKQAQGTLFFPDWMLAGERCHLTFHSGG